MLGGEGEKAFVEGGRERILLNLLFNTSLFRVKDDVRIWKPYSGRFT